MARRERMAGRRNSWYSGTKPATNKRFSGPERSVNLDSSEKETEKRGLLGRIHIL